MKCAQWDVLGQIALGNTIVPDAEFLEKLKIGSKLIVRPFTDNTHKSGLAVSRITPDDHVPFLEHHRRRSDQFDVCPLSEQRPDHGPGPSRRSRGQRVLLKQDDRASTGRCQMESQARAVYTTTDDYKICCRVHKTCSRNSILLTTTS